MSTTPVKPGDTMNKASDMANDAADRAKQFGNEAADRAKQMGRDAMDRLDAGRSSLAEGIHSTADAVRSKIPEPVADKAREAADAVERAADYVKSRDIKSMASDLTSAVRQHPGPSIIAALAFGFLLGVALRRD